MSNNGSKVASSLVRLVNALPHSARQQKLYAAALTRVAARTEGPLYIELRGEKPRRLDELLASLQAYYNWCAHNAPLVNATVMFQVPHALAAPRFPLSVELQCEISTENVSPSKAVDNDDDGSIPSFAAAGLGGTFDHLHAGHKLLLSAAAAVATRRLLVGITDESMLQKKKFASFIEPFERRASAVVDFVRLINPDVSVEVARIHDPIGPAGSDPDLDCLVVSLETAGGVDVINKVRLERGLKELATVVVPLVDADSDDSAEAKMSSTAIRAKLAAKQKQEQEQQQQEQQH
jgi:phosphopantetheine adenylyltransferase